MIKELLHSKIFEIGSHRVMFDFDLSVLYNVETRVLSKLSEGISSVFPRIF